MNFKYWNRGRVLNVKKIIAVKNATYAVAKKIPEKTFQACRESGTPTSAIPLQRSNQMSYEIKVEPQAFHTVNDKPKFPHLVVAYGRLPNIRGQNFDCEK